MCVKKTKQGLLGGALYKTQSRGRVGGGGGGGGGGLCV